MSHLFLLTPPSETTCICGGQFLAYKQLPISSPCISLLLCLRVSAAPSAICLAVELGGSSLPGTILNQWGMRVMSNTPSFQLISSHSWSTFCKVSQSIRSSTAPTLSTAAVHDIVLSLICLPFPTPSLVLPKTTSQINYITQAFVWEPTYGKTKLR